MTCRKFRMGRFMEYGAYGRYPAEPAASIEIL